MLDSRFASIIVRFLQTPRELLRTRTRSGLPVAALLGVCAAMLSITLPGSSSAQDWGGESDLQSGSSGLEPPTGWSLRTGIGFTASPDTFLMNFEAPYAFDRWVSAGPMLQVGLSNDDTIVAPTLNATVTIPDLPGESLDRLHPYGFIGIGFAYIKDRDRGKNRSDTGFLVDFGFGLEYQISEKVFVGSQMMFNFLPKKTTGQNFFYAWQIGSVRIAF